MDLRRAGRELRGHCPFHEDHTPSFHVNDELGVYHCFGCEAGGDVITFIQTIEGLTFHEACGWIANGFLPNRPFPKPAKDLRDSAKVARDLWRSTSSIEGTLAARYLMSRSIPLRVLMMQDDVRYAELPFDNSKHLHPALVVAARNADGQICAVQMTFLNDEGKKISNDCRRTRGSLRGAAVRLLGKGNPLAVDDEIYISEGTEDGLSVASYWGDKPVWVTLGTSNMASLILPPRVREVTIACDNDDAGAAAAGRATEIYVKGGRDVSITAPPAAFKDWNEFYQAQEFDDNMEGNPEIWDEEAAQAFLCGEEAA